LKIDKVRESRQGGNDVGIGKPIEQKKSGKSSKKNMRSVNRKGAGRKRKSGVRGKKAIP